MDCSTQVNPVWTFSLSNDEDYPETNSHRLVRFSIWPPNKNEALLASETCRQLMEGCPEWMIKVARRVQQEQQQQHAFNNADMDTNNTTNEKRQFIVRFVYESGVETILLVDGAKLPTNKQRQQQVDQIPTVHIGLSMATVSSETSCLSKMDPIVDDVVLVSSSSMNFICMAAGNNPGSIRFTVRVLPPAVSSQGSCWNVDLNDVLCLETCKNNPYVATYCERFHSSDDAPKERDELEPPPKGRNARKQNDENQRPRKRAR
eukprot:scaffold16706_cov153-Amphora_coffeaeformis.AAC.1